MKTHLLLSACVCLSALSVCCQSRSPVAVDPSKVNWIVDVRARPSNETGGGEAQLNSVLAKVLGLKLRAVWDQMQNMPGAFKNDGEQTVQHDAIDWPVPAGGRKIPCQNEETTCPDGCYSASFGCVMGLCHPICCG